MSMPHRLILIGGSAVTLTLACLDTDWTVPSAQLENPFVAGFSAALILCLWIMS